MSDARNFNFYFDQDDTSNSFDISLPQSATQADPLDTLSCLFSSSSSSSSPFLCSSSSLSSPSCSSSSSACSLGFPPADPSCCSFASFCSSFISWPICFGPSAQVSFRSFAVFAPGLSAASYRSGAATALATSSLQRDRLLLGHVADALHRLAHLAAPQAMRSDQSIQTDDSHEPADPQQQSYIFVRVDADYECVHTL
eukprot:GHVT01068584.1.p1 GENE.GHVT01068584.1~~GHVT01068584.1.p1  ORF type:complete len:198 (-),score=55.67 GHVT01068584.1:308-901(-)